VEENAKQQQKQQKQQQQQKQQKRVINEKLDEPEKESRNS